MGLQFALGKIYQNFLAISSQVQYGFYHSIAYN